MNKYTIEQVLPHRAPMILLSSLESYTAASCCCCVDVDHNSAFYNEQKQGVPSYIGSEYMAQTIAAFAGAHALDGNDAVQIGFLLGSRKFKTFQAYFYQGDKLTVTAKELYREDSGLRVFECEIINAEKQLLAQANINVFQPNDPQAFIEESYQ